MDAKQLNERLAGAMTVGELKGMLDCFSDDQVVMFNFNSGDYWNTRVAVPVDEVDHANVVWSDYHNKFKLADEGDDGAVDVIMIG